MAAGCRGTGVTFRTIAIMQARMGSTRLPGKMLIQLAGKPLVEWAVERIGSAKLVDELVLATTINKQDDLLEEFAVRRDISCFRGSENDVLDRYYHAARAFDAQVVVRLTGDNPLVDGNFVDWVVREYFNTGADYVAGMPGKEAGLPTGLAAEVFSLGVLSVAWEEDTNSNWREHVTLFIRRHAERFHVHYLKSPCDYSALRVTVDVPEDMKLMRRVFDYLGHRSFSWEEALDLLRQRPSWIALNQGAEQRRIL